MKKFFIPLFLLLLLLAGCGSKEPQGIYYPALSTRFLSKQIGSRFSGACYADISHLSYKDRLYNRTQRYREYSKHALPLDMLGEELCTIYGNLTYYWADTKEQLAEVTTTGTLYQINTYDEAFRVALYFEEPANVTAGVGPTYYLYIFECTNDITLHTGRDYYEALYHLKSDTSFDDLDRDDTTVSSFVDALLDAELIDPDQTGLPEFDFDKEQTFYLSFTDSLGLTGSFAIYEDGYVVDPADHNFIVKLTPALCTAILDKLPTAEWPGSYLYNTYELEENIRIQHYYQLGITETDTHYTFDLLVKESRVPLVDGAIDTSIAIGPAGSISLAKNDLKSTRLVSFVLQPELSELEQQNREGHSIPSVYVELKKGLQDDIIYLRYGSSEEETAAKDYILLNKQK